VIYRGSKPWTTRKRLGLEATQEAVWVIGDQILTDGLLAWRIGAAYIVLAIDIEQETSGQTTMRRIGRRLSPIFFTSSESR
jgi:predicted HAD superfamily phosphohydrolase YqeG